MSGQVLTVLNEHAIRNRDLLLQVTTCIVIIIYLIPNGSDSGDGSESDDDGQYHNYSAARRARGTLRQKQEMSTLETELQIHKHAFQNLNQDNERRELQRRKNSEDARQLDDALERKCMARALKSEKKKRKKLMKKFKKQSKQLKKRRTQRC